MNGRRFMVSKIISTKNRFAKRLGIQIKCILANWLLCTATAFKLKIFAERKLAFWSRFNQ